LNVSREFLAQVIIELEEDGRRLLRVTSASGGLSSLEMNEEELRRISRGSRERIRRRMIQRSVNDINREIRDLERERERLENDRRRLELEQFRMSTRSEGGSVNMSLLWAINLASGLTLSWFTPHQWLFWSFLALGAVAGLVLVGTRKFYESKKDLGKRRNEKLRQALQDITQAAKAWDADQANTALSRTLIFRIFGDPLQFPVSQEAVGKQDKEIYFGLVRRAVRENPQGMLQLLISRGFLETNFSERLSQWGLEGKVQEAVRTLKEASSFLRSDLIPLPRIFPEKTGFMAFADSQRMVETSA
jgi:hypothetical protein